MPTKPIALQRCLEFVGRTTNWLYDHLRYVPRHSPAVLCNRLTNREEFPELEARAAHFEHLSRRIWRRLAGARLYPAEKRWISSLSPVALHSHFGHQGYEDQPLQLETGLPWVVSFYGADVYQLGRLAAWRDNYAPMFDRVSRILALGPIMASKLEELGCPKDKILVHPLGVDVEGLPFQPRTMAKDETMRLLFAGTFREKKGIEYVLQGAAHARKAGVRLELEIVGDSLAKQGDDETKEAIGTGIDKLGLSDVVKRSPFLPFEELLKLALQCHVFVAPSVVAEDGDAEGTPFVLQQMMATGMPSIATVHSDIPFLFGEHKDLLVAERDWRAIGERLIRYADSPGDINLDGEKLGTRVRTSLDVRQCAARLSDIYEAIT